MGEGSVRPYRLDHAFEAERTDTRRCHVSNPVSSTGIDSAWHNGGAEQLPLFDSPVSGMVLAPHQGAKQECNRPDQLRQCRDHCYSDLGFLLPVTTSPPSRLAMVFSHCPVTSSHRNRSPAGIRASRGGAVEAALSSHCVQSSRVRVKRQNVLVLW